MSELVFDPKAVAKERDKEHQQRMDAIKLYMDGITDLDEMQMAKESFDHDALYRNQPGHYRRGRRRLSLVRREKE